MKSVNFKSIAIAFASVIFISLSQSCNQPSGTNAAGTDNVDSLKKIAIGLIASNDSISSYLKTFNALDFDVFSNQQ